MRKRIFCYEGTKTVPHVFQFLSIVMANMVPVNGCGAGIAGMYGYNRRVKSLHGESGLTRITLLASKRFRN